VDAFHVAHPAAPRRLAATIFAMLPWQSRPISATTSSCSLWELGHITAATGTSAVRGG
jgi:hypothetical protein